MNAFTIPDKSTVLEGNRRDFPKVARKRPRGMNPIQLPGGSKYPPLKTMRKEKP